MRVDFSAENKTSQYNGFPKVTVDKGEDARICILESPLLVFKHTVQKPIIDPTTGKIAQKTEKNSKGEEYEKDAYEYVGAYVCNGDPEKVQNDPDGLDVEGCALCAAAANHGTTKFKAPTQAFACHVIQYKTKPGTTQVQDPFQADLKLWVMAPAKFNAVVDLASEHGDIRKTDILLTECTNKTFQNYKIGAAATGKAVWMQSDASKATVTQLLQNNRADEDKVRDTVARKLTPTSAKTVVDEVLERWALEGQAAGAVNNNAMSGELGGLAAASQQDALNTSDAPWGASNDSGAPDFSKPSTGSDDTVGDSGSTSEDTLSFDSLLDGLGG